MLKQKLKTFSSDVQCHALKQKTKPPSYDQVSPPPTYDVAMFMWDIQHPRQFSTYAKILDFADILY